MMLMLMVLVFQVHTILSPGDNLGLVIRGGAEYGVSWSFGWWSWDHLIFGFERLSHYCHQVGIYVLQVDQNSLAESLGLQVHLYSPYTQSECLKSCHIIFLIFFFVHPLKICLIFPSAGLPPHFHHWLSQSEPFNLRSQEPNFTPPTSSKSKEKAFRHRLFHFFLIRWLFENCPIAVWGPDIWGERNFFSQHTPQVSLQTVAILKMKWNDS